MGTGAINKTTVIRMNNNSIFPVLVSLLVSFSIALFAYFLLIHFVVDTDLHTSHREIALLDFYQQPHTNDIFILGSSFVTEGVDGNLVEKSLRERGINRSVYNLGIQAETPLSRLPELENLIASKPGDSDNRVGLSGPGEPHGYL